jgi:hypothetical protein
LNIFKVQKKFTEQSDSENEEEITQNIDRLNSLETNFKKRHNSSIPKLDLSKAKKIQLQNIKKIDKMNFEQTHKTMETSEKIFKY